MQNQDWLSCTARHVLLVFTAICLLVVQSGTPLSATTDPSIDTENGAQESTATQEQILIAPAIAAALIAAGVVVVGGIISWILDQSDDVTAQGTAVATADWSPTHCGEPTVLTCADDGFFSADCEVLVDNSCGRAFALAYVSSPLIGSETLLAYSSANTKPTHFVEEKHEVYAEAKVAVDKRTKSSRTGLRGAPTNSTGHPDGTVLATVGVDSFQVQVRGGSGAASTWEINYVATPEGGGPIDVLHSSGEIASDGTLTVTGDIPTEEFLLSQGPDGSWTVELNDYYHEVVVGFIDVGEELDVQMTANATTVLGDGIPAAPTAIASPSVASSKIVAVIPNPFNPSTTIRYLVGTSGRVGISIYDVNGRFVRTLVAREETAGEHVVTWDGLDAYGGTAASGVYFVKLAAGSESHSMKMVLLK